MNPFDMIVESPSFPRPGAGRQAGPLPAAPQVVERRSTRPERPPVIMSSAVREAKPGRETGVPMPAGSASAEDSAQPAKRVSRFKMERM